MRNKYAAIKALSQIILPRLYHHFENDFPIAQTKLNTRFQSSIIFLLFFYNFF